MNTFKGFSEVKLTKPKRSQFDLSHDKRLSCQSGQLVPVLMQECVPSDTFRGSTEILLRLAPLLAPIYDRIKLYVHYFFVPNRLLWDEWETFITGGRDPGVDPVTAPIPPRLDIGLNFGTTDGVNTTLADYMGLPDFTQLGDAAGFTGKFIDMMPFAAYTRVWFDYYRERNFIGDDDVPYGQPLTSGTQPPAVVEKYMGMLGRSYAHDYFTSALPWTQRGEEVLMPIQLGGLAPLYGQSAAPPSATMTLSGQDDGVNVGFPIIPDNTGPYPPSGDLFVKGEDFDGTSTSINDFRAAFALQVWLERNAVGGSRYTESTQAHFGVKPQDSRLQRAEYIGGGVIPVKISEVLATSWSQDDESAPVAQGNMAGHGVTYGNTNRFRYYCAEHGFIVGIMSIMPTASYQQGIPRMYKRGTFLDYPWPTFAKLGEQPVNNFELYADPDSLTQDADGEYPIFGYQSRYADWKWSPTTNHRDFRNSLLFWHLTRVFDTPPVIGPAFNVISGQNDYRIFAAPGLETDYGFPYWVYLHNRISVIRPLPYFGTPNTMGFV